MLKIKCPVCSHIMDFNTDKGILTCSECNSDISVTKIDMPEYGLYKKSSYINEIAAKNIIQDDSIVTDDIKPDINPEDIYDISAYIPFETSLDDVVNSLRAWGGKKIFTSTSFNKALNEKNISMDYYPAFLFSISAYGEIHSVCTQNDDDISSHITRTHYYDIYRKSELKNHHVLSSASDSISDMVLEGLLPYDFDKLTAYSQKSSDIKPCDKITKKSSLLYKNVRNQLTDQIYKTLWNSLDMYSSKHNSDTSVSIYDLNIKAILIPVWHLSYNNRNITKHIYINGTDKTIYGEYPLSPAKVILCSVLSGFILFLIIMCIITFII